MILKNIFGKTVEAAKKTAHQMYGDDILILEASEATSDGQNAKITIFSDSQREEKLVLEIKQRISEIPSKKKIMVCSSNEAAVLFLHLTREKIPT